MLLFSSNGNIQSKLTEIKTKLNQKHHYGVYYKIQIERYTLVSCNRNDKTINELNKMS